VLEPRLPRSVVGPAKCGAARQITLITAAVSLVGTTASESAPTPIKLDPNRPAHVTLAPVVGPIPATAFGSDSRCNRSGAVLLDGGPSPGSLPSYHLNNALHLPNSLLLSHVPGPELDCELFELGEGIADCEPRYRTTSATRSR
jgi:hypothetical protein